MENKDLEKIFYFLNGKSIDVNIRRGKLTFFAEVIDAIKTIQMFDGETVSRVAHECKEENTWSINRLEDYSTEFLTEMLDIISDNQ